MEVLTDGWKTRTVYIVSAWNQVMGTDLDLNEIDKLETVLNTFKNEWEELQNQRAKKWRRNFLIGFCLTIILSILNAEFWWSSILVIGYFAGSLFSMLRQNTKTSKKIIEQQKQLRLVKLLSNFETIKSQAQK